MVTQEGAPSLGQRSASLDHILRDAGLRDLKAELEQLAMDARRSPQRIVNAHPPDQRAQVRVDLRPATSMGIPVCVWANARGSTTELKTVTRAHPSKIREVPRHMDVFLTWRMVTPQTYHTILGCPYGSLPPYG